MKIGIAVWDTKILKNLNELSDDMFRITYLSASHVTSEIYKKTNANSVLLESTNINDMMSDVVTLKLDYAIIFASGSIVKNAPEIAREIVNYCKSVKPDVAGHIVDIGKKHKDILDLQNLYGLHEQFFILGYEFCLNAYQRFKVKESFKYQSERFPICERSSEDIHDDYTPFWIKKGKRRKRIRVIKDFDFCVLHDLIQFAVNENFIIRNIPKEIRNQKCYSYHLEDSENSFQEKLNGSKDKCHDGQLDFFKNFSLISKQQVYTCNTENIDVLPIGKDIIVSVASGHLPLELIYQNKKTLKKYIFVDINYKAINFYKHILKYCKDYDSWKDLVESYSDEVKNSNISVITDSHNIILQKIKEVDLSKIEFLFYNESIIYLNENIKKELSRSKNPYIWFSNVFSYLPEYKELTNVDNQICNFLTEILKSNYSSDWYGSGPRGHISSLYDEPKSGYKYFSENPWTLPVEVFLEEINSLERHNLFTPHRDSESHRGWSSFVLHGIGYNKTLSYDQYGYANDAETPYRWTEEAIEHVPSIVTYFKEKEIKKEYFRVRIMKLDPGGFIGVHCDNKKSDVWATNISINNPEGCEMHFWTKNFDYAGKVPWKDNVSYNIRIGDYHCVFNNSSQVRYHMIVHGKD